MTQADRILAYLRKGHILTAIEAIDRFGCYRLAARIYDLRKRGHVICSITGIGNFVCYRLGELYERRARS